jgi:DME family drug/metabolite transporter
LSHSVRRGYLLALLATAIWSSSGVMISYLSRHYALPPLTLAFWRDVLVTLALALTLALVARPFLRLPLRWLPFCVLFGLVLAAFNAMFTISTALNGAAVATVLIYSSPIFTALAGWLLWREPLGPPKIAAAVLSLAGCVFVSGAYDAARWSLNPLGIALGLGSGLGFAAYGLLGKAAHRRGIPSWTTLLYTFAFASVFLLFVQRPLAVRALTPPGGDLRAAVLGWGLLLALALGPSLGGYGLYGLSLAHLPTGTANLIITLEPPMTAALAYWFLGDRLTLPQLAGGALVLGALLLLGWSDRALGRTHTPRARLVSAGGAALPAEREADRG